LNDYRPLVGSRSVNKAIFEGVAPMEPSHPYRRRAVNVTIFAITIAALVALGRWNAQYNLVYKDLKYLKENRAYPLFQKIVDKDLKGFISLWQKQDAHTKHILSNEYISR
jgi:hypothetical protein